MSQKRALLQQAATLLLQVSEHEQAINACKVAASMLSPGQTIVVEGIQCTREGFQRVQAEMEAEIAGVKKRARELQDQALSMKN